MNLSETIAFAIIVFAGGLYVGYRWGAFALSRVEAERDAVKAAAAKLGVKV